MFGSAQWIGVGSAVRTPCIRADFYAPPSARGRITICGLGFFELYINGRRIGDQLFVPAVSDYCPRDIIKNGQPFPEEWNHRCYVMQYDLEEALVQGNNQLAVALGPGFFASPQCGYDAPLTWGDVRLCYRIEMTGEDGASAEAVSGADARWTPGFVQESDFLHGEHHDLRALGEDWTTADASAWPAVTLLEPMETDYRLQDCPADRVIRWIEPQYLRSFPDWTLYDAGENITGWVVLRDESAAGEKIAVEFSENLNCCGALDELYMHWQYFDAISDGQGRTVHPRFTWNGFRYFAVSGKASVLGVAVIHSDVRASSSFRCSDETLNWLHEAYVRTQLCNLHGGIPSDCPHLERRGYTGDGQLTAETALLTLNHTALMRKWLQDILDGQDRHTGHVQNTAPYIRSGGGPGGWGYAVVAVPLALYRHTGDAEAIKTAMDGMRRYLDYLWACSDEGLVVRDTPGEWCLGDWCCPGSVKIPEPFVNTYFHIKALDGVAEAGRILGVAPDLRWLSRRAQAVQAMTERYFDAGTGDFCGGIQGTNAFALDVGLGDSRTLQRLAARYEALGGLDTGIFGTEIVVRLLLQNGYGRVAYRLLTSDNPASFYGWKKAGATTLWEYWPGTRQRSMSHPMFGAVVKELYYEVLGLRREAPGWRAVRIAPALTGEVPEAQGHITTPQGILAVSYVREGEKIRLRVRIPEHTHAVLCWQGNEWILPSGESDRTLCV